MHDATTHWVKQINTVFLRVVSGDGEIFKVPFSITRIPGSLTGEKLCDQLMAEISKVKNVPNNATDKIEDAIKVYRGYTAAKPEQKLKKLHLALKEAAENAELEKLLAVKTDMERLLEMYPQLKLLDVNTIQCDIESLQDEDTILPVFPPIFKIAKLVGIENNTISLSIDPANVPTTTCGDGCTLNLKGCRLLEEKYGINSPVSKCGSHLSYGTIRRLCTSVSYSQEDAKKLYENLKAILRHFTMSPKSRKLLNNAPDALEMNNVHILNWGSTRMAGFLDACIQASSIIVPFLDTIVTGSIREEEMMFLASPKRVFLLQLFADLHPVFTGKYLHYVDKDDVLVCEFHRVAHNTAKYAE